MRSILLIIVIPVACSFVLEGSDTSYARFSRWNVNTTLSFEFTTNQPDGLILYSDDGGKTDFFELKLVEGILRLRFNLLNQGTQLINIGQHLNDGLWHRVELSVTLWNVLVTVDGFVSQGRNMLSDKTLISFDNTGVFIGGLPGYFNSRLGELTLPSVVFEPRFRGAIRNLVFGAITNEHNNKIVVKPQEIVESKGLISGSATSEACERHDPCLHGGFCISTDSGPVCDCKHIDFEGVNCEVEKSPTTATFHGTEYIGYDFRESGGQQPIISQLDEISLYFKTSTRNKLLLHTLLFYSGDGVDYIALTIRNGQLMLSINLGSGPLDTKLHPDHLRFDDGEWHSVRVHRKIQEMSRTTSLCHISASVDGIHFDRWTLAGSFTLLSSNRVTVAGYDTLRPLNGIRGVTNFIGCLKKVEYRADTLRLNILELARSGNRLVTISGGRIVFHCQENIDAFETSHASGAFIVDNHPMQPHYTSNQQDNPITFTTPFNSYLVVMPYTNVSSHTTSITLKLRTTEPNGLVVYTSTPPSALAIEIIDGILYTHMKTNNVHTRIQATSSRINDGEWHTIKIIRNGRSGTISVDDFNTDFNLKSESRVLVLGIMYLGNVPSHITDDKVWNVGLGNGFVGCLKNVVIEHTLVDLVHLANNQDVGGIRPFCQVGSAGECVSNPCMNNGKCADGWGRFVCECLWAGYDGAVCQVDAPYIDFGDASVYELTNRSSSGSPVSSRLFSPTQAQDIKFRFKSLNPNAVLLSVSGTESDFIEVRIGGGVSNVNAGKLRVRVRLKDSEKTLSVGHSSTFNDNSWHVFRFMRRGGEIRVFVDDLPPVSGMLTARNPTLSVEKITLSSMTSPFTGLIQSLSMNNVGVLSVIKLKRLNPTGSFPKIKYFKSINNPINFPKRKPTKTQAYITLPQLKAYASLRMRFKFKTQSAAGVLFYNGASSSTDYICVQIQDFKLTFSMGFGETDKGVEIISHRLKLNSWVDVDVYWDGGDTVVMGVDQYVYEEKIRGSSATTNNLVLKLNGALYVGGGIGDAFFSRVHGYAHFVGCLANVDVAGDTITFDTIGVGGISHGCGDDTTLEPYNPVSTRCSTDTCENGGACVEEPDNSVTCDCEMTSYTGPTCSLESTTYEFSMSSMYARQRGHSHPGVIQFTYQQNREPTTLHDNIAFGFITAAHDAVVLRIESVKTTDYLEIEVISGKLRVTYNMYLNKDNTIGEVTRNVNDEGYHVVKFVRNGANATLQIDNSDIITTYPMALKENLFNSIGLITIGGRVKELKRETTVLRSFKGIISGLVINGMHILDMAMNGDPRIKIHGDVRKIRSIGTVTSQFPLTTFRSTRKEHPAHSEREFQRAQPASSSSTTLSDDLVNSGDSSHNRCMETDDEDNEECAGTMSSGFTDDIITPVYTPTTRLTTTITTTKSNQDSNMYFPCADDDEDCGDYGSGVIENNRGSSTHTSTIITTTYTDGSSSITTTNNNPITTEREFRNEMTPIRSTTTEEGGSTITDTSKPETEGTDRTTSQTTTTTRFIPPHPPSIPPYQKKGPLFDFDTTTTTTTTPATIEKKKSYNETVYFADSGDSTLIIIIIIAVLMIIIVSILIIFFMCKRRDDPIYKIEASQQPQPIPQHGAVQQVAGPREFANPPAQGVIPQRAPNPPGGPRKTGVKEWYV
ncbi:unnamed protein product [Orchesella dallaii]|uniref:Neurexin-1 n=1 Tax=Orchesella dallaii TaxID=48710 RepID=A0ABP1Q669_9HEXA